MQLEKSLVVANTAFNDLLDILEKTATMKFTRSLALMSSGSNSRDLAPLFSDMLANRELELPIHALLLSTVVGITEAYKRFFFLSVTQAVLVSLRLKAAVDSVDIEADLFRECIREPSVDKIREFAEVSTRLSRTVGAILDPLTELEIAAQEEIDRGKQSYTGAEVLEILKKVRAVEKQLTTFEQILAEKRVVASKHLVEYLAGKAVRDHSIFVSVDLAQLKVIMFKKRSLALLKHFASKSQDLTDVVRDEILTRPNCPMKIKSLFREFEEAERIHSERSETFNASQNILSSCFASSENISEAEKTFELSKDSVSFCLEYGRAKQSLLHAYARLLEALC